MNYSLKKNEKRTERIIYFSKSINISYLNKVKCKEFFLDITYNIIPRKFRPYKLLVISGMTTKINYPMSIIFILLKYTDLESINRIFNYMYDNFEFSPEIIHTIFDTAISKAIA